MINTVYIERLNATFRQRLACLFRRTRHLARQSTTLHESRYTITPFLSDRRVSFAHFEKTA
jgi:hypothetical protein